MASHVTYGAEALSMHLVPVTVASQVQQPTRQTSETTWNSLERTKTYDDSSVSSFSATSSKSSSTAFTLAEESNIARQPPLDPSINMPFEDNYLAFGTIVLYHERNDDSEVQLMMRGSNGTEPYPNPLLTTATRKGWVRIDEIQAGQQKQAQRLRVSVLPEDVSRGNRGSIKDFRKVIKYLLGFVNRSIDAWVGRATLSSSHVSYETPRTAQEESLFYIFNTLQSPCPNLDCFHPSTYGYQAVSDALDNAISGLKTQLYPYQHRSVAAMIQREAEPAKILDPRKPVFKDIYGRSFYLDISDGTLLKYPTLYTEPQGGILAETMGYGKTLICIALILATKGHYPRVPEDRVDSVPFQPREKVGSLMAMAARRTKYEGLPWKAEFNALRKNGYQYDRCLEELKKYEREYAEPIFTPTTPDRKGKRDSANLVRLCSATLIIVPPNLLVQWQQEIKKHTEEDALDVLIIESPSKEVPQWQELVHYDVVLITKARFEQEYRDDDLHQGKTRKGDARYRSSLTDVRWLRVICDEGHGFAGSSSRTNAMAMLDKMYIERRWVVSGTPSSTLHGVEVGLSTTSSSSVDSNTASPSKTLASARKESLQSALQKRRAPNAIELEAKDLERLRLIVVNFLRLQPWANQRGSSDVANWKKYLASFTDADGRRCTSPALRDVLQSLIIRHRIEDIDTDLTLPPLHNRVVYLEPSYHDKLAINMFFLVLTSNYVTSEREDEDYMFHPRNRKKLDQLINNFRQASFHWVGFSEHDIRETLRISNDYLNKNVDRISDADGLLLTEAIQNGERALADPSWKAFANLHEIGVYVKNFPIHARDSWALDGSSDDPVLLGTLQARETQKYIRERLNKNTDDPLLGFAGAGVRAVNAAKSRAEDDLRAQQRVQAKSSDGDKQQVGAVEEPKLKAHGASITSPVRSFTSRSVMSKKRRRNSSSGAPALITPPASPASSERPSTTTLPSSSAAHITALRKPTISSFTSSKLTYLLTRLLTLPSATKSLVFYQHNNTAFFIAEALELLNIPFRIYANTLSVTQRNTYLADFNAPDSGIRVLLMDVKQASHGLHVAAASYVCIICPIWDAGVESQAVKRAHRIGQTREVVVETLVLSGSFEEDMVRRRKWRDENLDCDDDQDTVVSTRPSQDVTAAAGTGDRARNNRPRNAGESLLDDRHMVSVLKDIKFLKFSLEEREVGGRVREMNDVPVEKRRLFGHVLREVVHSGESKEAGVNRDRKRITVGANDGVVEDNALWRGPG